MTGSYLSVFDNNLNFSIFKTDIIKNGLTLVNERLEGQKHSKGSNLPHNFEFDAIWTALQLNSRISSALWLFCRICDFRASFLGYRVQNENPEIKKNLYLLWLAMWLNHFEIDVFWTAFQGFLWSYIQTFQYFGFLMNFRDFPVFVFGYRVYNENPEITENHYFLVYNTPMHVDLCFDHYFNGLSAKNYINKNRLNLIYSEASKTFKTQLAPVWLTMWLDHFEIDIVWTAFKEFLKLHTHISVFWGFSWISGISEFSFLGIGHKTKTRKSHRTFIFWFITLQCMWICVLTTILTVWVLKLT